MRRALALGIAALTLASCSGERGSVEVFAAASLSDVFERLMPDAVFNFAGSDELATQILNGATPDVYASASSSQADRLTDLALIEPAVTFATNELVIVVPVDAPERPRSWRDLERDGTRIVIGAQGVPAGDYARAAIDALEAPAILDNVVSEEQDVRAVLAKVALGEADAGFVYATDVDSASDDVDVIAIPAAAQPPIVYVIAPVISGDEDRAAAVIDKILSEDGRAALRAAGFGIP